MEGRGKGTSKSSTTVAVYIVVLESHPYVGLNRAATGKKSEGERTKTLSEQSLTH